MDSTKRAKVVSDPEVSSGLDEAVTGSDNGRDPTLARRGSGRRRKADDDDFICEVEKAPALVPDGDYDVRVDRLERWKFPGTPDAWKLTLRCSIFGGPYNGVVLPLRMPWHWPARWSSKLGETIKLATGGSIPKRSSRISLKRLFVGRVFRAQVRTLISPRRDRFGKPLLDQSGATIEKSRESIIDHFIETLAGTPDDYLL